MLRSEYRRERRHARISSCSKKDVDYLLDYPGVERASPTRGDPPQEPDQITCMTGYCPPPFAAAQEVLDAQIDVNTPQDIPNEDSSCRSVPQCAITLTQYSTPKMTAIEDDNDPSRECKPPPTLGFALKTACPKPADLGVARSIGQDDEQKTTSTPQIRENSPPNWLPFPRQLMHAEEGAAYTHNDPGPIPIEKDLRSLELINGEIRLSSGSWTPTRRR